MKEIDVSSLKDIDVQYERLSSQVEEHFKGDWDDPVHDSYGRYVKQVKGCSERLKYIRSRAETLSQEVAALKIDELRNKSDMLCREADLL